MASGLQWQDYIGKAVACPAEWAFGILIVLDGNEWVCLDRGGKIKVVDGIPWVDFLEAEARYPHGSLIEVTLR